jgi:hypothetical protein
VPNIPTVPYQPAQVLASNVFGAGAAGSIIIPGKTGVQTVVTGVQVTAGVATATIHGVWTISDGVWTLNFYVYMSATIPMPPVLLPFAPPLMSSAIGAAIPSNANIVIAMPAITGGAPYALAAEGYYL